MRKRASVGTGRAVRYTLFFFSASVLWITSGCESPQDDLKSRRGGPPEPLHVILPDANATVETEKTTANASSRTSKERKASGDGNVDSSSGTISDIILVPLQSYGKVKTKLDQIQITKQMKIFRAEKNRNPKDFAEYKREILTPVGITLPELPQGDRYVYQPEEGPSGALMVQSTK